MSIPDNVVWIVGDEIAAGKGCAPGQCFVDIVADALIPHGVDLVPGSVNEGETAYMLVAEDDKHQDFKVALRSSVEGCHRLVVVLALGANDRVLFSDAPEMLEQALAVLIRDIQEVGARPLLMQIVPDGLDERVGMECGAGLVPVPISLVKEYRQDTAGGQPFVPSQQAHRDMAQQLLMVLEEELQLRRSPSSSHSRSRAGTKGKPSRQGSDADFDGVWEHKGHPGQLENIQDGVIKSDDGTYAQLECTGPGKCFIDTGGMRVDGEIRGDELHWSDGDVWMRLKDSDVPTLSAPPSMRNRSQKCGDTDSFLKVWAAADKANERSRKEANKGELLIERDVLEQAHERLREERQHLEESKRRLAEEWQAVNELRERAAAQSANPGFFAWCQG